MAFSPKEILLVTFGDYAKDPQTHEYKNNLPSFPQLPLVYGFNGFSTLDFWSVPNNALRYSMVFGEEDAETLRQLAVNFGTQMKIHIKCEGNDYGCTNEATGWMLPYEKQKPNEHRATPSGDGMVKQALPERSLFCCESCKNVQRGIWGDNRNKGLIDFDISFRLPRQFNKYSHEADDWSLNKGMLHGKLKGVMAHLICNPVGNEINTRRLSKGVITKYAANIITARLLGFPEDELPKTYDVEERRVHWEKAGQMDFTFPSEDKNFKKSA